MSKQYIGIDWAEGGDYSAYVVMKRPSKFRNFMRKLGIDQSKWEWQMTEMGEIAKKDVDYAQPKSKPSIGKGLK